MTSLLLAAAAGLLLVADAAPPQLPTAEDELCADRAGCRVEKTHDAGLTADRDLLEVIELGIDNPAGAETPCSPKRREFVLSSRRLPPGLTRDETGIIRNIEPTYTTIFSVCALGYGNSNVSEPEIKVGDNLLTFSHYGGSSSRFEAAYKVQLSPLRVIDQSHCTFDQLRPGFNATEVNLKDLIINGHRKRFTCTAEGMPDVSPTACNLQIKHTKYLGIPLIEMALPADNAAAINVTDCGARVDSSGKTGFIPYGKSGDAEDARMTAVFTDATTLVVTVVDDIFYENDKDWVTSDHLEIWTGPTAVDCEDPAVQPAQWAIMPMDGKVIKARGPDAKAPTAQAQLNVTEPKAPTPMTFVVRFAEAPQRITVVYSDSDNGRFQERLLATSALTPGRNETLGQVESLSKEAAQCQLKDNVISRTSWGDVKLVPVNE